MFSSRRPNIWAVAFLILFAALGTSSSFVDVGFYRHTVGRFIEIGLVSISFLSLLALMALCVWRSWRNRKIEWILPATALLSLVGMETLWRTWIGNLPFQLWKVVAFYLDVALPLVAALGVTAVITDARERSSSPIES